MSKNQSFCQFKRRTLWTDGRTDRQTDVWTDGWTNTRTDRRKDGLMDRWIKRPSRSLDLIEYDLNEPIFQADSTLFKDTGGGGGCFLMGNLFEEVLWIGHQRLIYEKRTYLMISISILYVFNIPKSRHFTCFFGTRDLDGSQDLEKNRISGGKKSISGFRIQANQMTLIRMNPTFRDPFFFQVDPP